MQHGRAGAVEPLSLAGQSSAVLLVVDQDVKHGAALLIALSQAALQHLYVRAQSALDPHGRARILYHGLRHRDQARPSLSPPPCFCRFSSSFSRAIIFSSRPTTTSSNFSRSKIRSEEHTSELQSQSNLVCRLLLEKKNTIIASQS